MALGPLGHEPVHLLEEFHTLALHFIALMMLYALGVVKPLNPTSVSTRCSEAGRQSLVQGAAPGANNHASPWREGFHLPDKPNGQAGQAFLESVEKSLNVWHGGHGSTDFPYPCLYPLQNARAWALI